MARTSPDPTASDLQGSELCSACPKVIQVLLASKLRQVELGPLEFQHLSVAGGGEECLPCCSERCFSVKRAVLRLPTERTGSSIPTCPDQVFGGGRPSDQMDPRPHMGATWGMPDGPRDPGWAGVGLASLRPAPQPDMFSKYYPPSFCSPNSAFLVSSRSWYGCPRPKNMDALDVTQSTDTGFKRSSRWQSPRETKNGDCQSNDVDDT